jgi:hypothetical protein
MNVNLFAIIAILAYLTAAALLAKPAAVGNNRKALAGAGLAICLHHAQFATQRRF